MDERQYRTGKWDSKQRENDSSSTFESYWKNRETGGGVAVRDRETGGGVAVRDRETGGGVAVRDRETGGGVAVRDRETGGGVAVRDRETGGGVAVRDRETGGGVAVRDRETGGGVAVRDRGTGGGVAVRDRETGGGVASLCHVSISSLRRIIRERRLRFAGHSLRNKAEIVSDVLLWARKHGHASVGRPCTTYIQQLCEDAGCRPEDLPRAMEDREGWRKRVTTIRETLTTR
ncbi:hypothetical protein Bbelb_155650 [Branchiostoma belcheri]|nr:hypothetical protein Bbelb_155650 [Branchiostoma belcheri]